MAIVQRVEKPTAAAHLARYSLFGLLSRGQLDEWLAAGQEAAYSAGETIFQENSPV